MTVPSTPSPIDSYKSQMDEYIKELNQPLSDREACIAKIEAELNNMANDPKLKDYFEKNPNAMKNIYAAMGDFKAASYEKDISGRMMDEFYGAKAALMAVGEQPSPPGPIPPLPPGPIPIPPFPPAPEPPPFPGPIPQPIRPVPEPEQPITPVPEPEEPIVPPGPTVK